MREDPAFYRYIAKEVTQVIAVPSCAWPYDDTTTVFRQEYTIVCKADVEEDPSVNPYHFIASVFSEIGVDAIRRHVSPAS